MRIKNLVVATLGVLSFICAIGLTPAMPLSDVQINRQSQGTEVLTFYQVSQTEPTAELRANGLEEEAERLYERGQFQKAIALLEQIRADYKSQGDELGQARVLRNLALVYQQTGEMSKANEAITNSLNHLPKESNTKESKQLLAQILEAQGLLQLSVGQSEEALETWKQAADSYQKIGDITGVTRSKINQAQALQRMGLYHETIKTLHEINVTLKQEPDSLLKAKGLQSLGNALRVTGELAQSEEILAQSLAIAQKLAAPESIASILLSLGNTARLQAKPQAALDYYQRAERTSPSSNLQIQSQVNQISLLVEQKEWSKAVELVPQIQSILTRFPVKRTTINASINLAKNMIKILKYGKINSLSYTYSNIAQLLATAVQEAENLQDPRTLAYALGSFGGLYEQKKQWDYAQELTNKALFLAQGINASDIAYQWQWQLGRILKQQGDREGAIAAYTEAVNTIQSIRSDLVAISSEAQFSFRESVEPVYRELIGLLLPVGEKVDQSALKKARQTIDFLQLAELDNFFRDACLNTQPLQIDNIDPKAAIFSTIILSDRLEVIVGLPGQPLRRYTTLLSQEEIEATLLQARNALTFPRLRISLRNFLVPSQKIYKWLIGPMETELADSGVQTLVFVLDGAIRNIPMSSLYDGEKYLVQKYSIAVAPGLQLIDAKPLQQGKLRVLTAGLSEARQGFSPLPGVKFELDSIGSEVFTEKLLDRSFTATNFKTKVKSSSFPIIHLATHGQFSSQANDTFILTWDDRINAKDLDSLLRADTRIGPVELLVLSACQTAAGDNRATLGLTGVAVRAGARSTVASLWSVSDEATALLMTRFYEELAHSQVNPGNKVTKAEALRRAEQAVLQDERFSHPYFWSAFVMVGNWL
ncbi:CHAT domain-containing protein [Argonema antarcticum]|uniref:CHAT domain-containing protein n=1 Tax=Argonema antarcticum TaxID=2942763 RepID=UPI00201360CD|nr:CHAT domain-containing protein [Argonema antarcticum]MCL1471529.1 CHAT domain-containing protein [Argonema antarcticum A004/B2]